MSLSDYFQNFQLIKANRKCFDCDTSNPSIASINHGVFICTQCSKLHQELGPSISFLKAVKDESWTFSQIATMLTGGNKRFRDFLSQFDLSSKVVIAEKYCSLPAEQYRKLLKSEAEYRQVSGSTMWNSEESERCDDVGLRNSENWWGTKNLLNAVVGKVSELGLNAKEKVKDGALIDSFKSRASGLMSSSIELKDRIKEKVNRGSISEFADRSLEMVENFGSLAYEKVKSVYVSPCMKFEETEMMDLGDASTITPN